MDQNLRDEHPEISASTMSYMSTWFWAYLLWLGQEGCGLGSTQFCSIGLKSSISDPIKRVACILREGKELGKTIQASLKTLQKTSTSIEQPQVGGT